MSGFFWNIRGFNKRAKQGVVKDWVKKSGFDFGCLIETKVKEKKGKQSCIGSVSGLVVFIKLRASSLGENMDTLERQCSCYSYL